jgi:putative transcriptional regulator
MNRPQDKHKRKKGKVVGDSVQNEILEALAEFTDALEKGEVTKRLTCWQLKLNLERTKYGPELVRKTRKSLGVSQVLFARFLGVSPKTVRSWEQGINTPNPMACRFMDVIRHDPAYWIQQFKDATVRRHECEELSF